jgi:hypothetical protein
MFYGRPFKSILDFEVKIFGHCSFAFGVQRAFVNV